MEIDAARALLDAYLDAEWAATVAAHTEPDDAVAERLGAIRSFLAESQETPFPSAVGRRRGLSEAQIAQRTEELPQYVRRTLFGVVEHANPLRGRLFAGYTGAARALIAGMYGRLLYVADTEAGPKVVSEYDSAGATGPVGWVHLGGVVVDNPGPVVAVLPVADPSWAAHGEHWRSLVEAAP